MDIAPTFLKNRYKIGCTQKELHCTVFELLKIKICKNVTRITFGLFSIFLYIKLCKIICLVFKLYKEQGIPFHSLIDLGKKEYLKTSLLLLGIMLHAFVL